MREGCTRPTGRHEFFECLDLFVFRTRFVIEIKRRDPLVSALPFESNRIPGKEQERS